MLVQDIELAVQYLTISGYHEAELCDVSEYCSL